MRELCDNSERSRKIMQRGPRIRPTRASVAKWGLVMPDTRVRLTVKDYAAARRVSVRTVHRWIKAGRLPVVRYSARTLRIEYVRALPQSSPRFHP